MTTREMIAALRKCKLSAAQRKQLNQCVRLMQAKRPGGGALHHPSHYMPQIRSLAVKFGILKTEEPQP